MENIFWWFFIFYKEQYFHIKALNLLHQGSMDLLYFLTHGDLLHKFANMSQTNFISWIQTWGKQSLFSQWRSENPNPPGQNCNINQSPNSSHVGNTTRQKLDLVLSMGWDSICTTYMYGCESWTVKKAECQRIDAFELWYWRRLLRVPWTARDPTSPFWKRSVLGFLWNEWC